MRQHLSRRCYTKDMNNRSRTPDHLQWLLCWLFRRSGAWYVQDGMVSALIIHGATKPKQYTLNHRGKAVAVRHMAVYVVSTKPVDTTNRPATPSPSNTPAAHQTSICFVVRRKCVLRGPDEDAQIRALQQSAEIGSDQRPEGRFWHISLQNSK